MYFPISFYICLSSIERGWAMIVETSRTHLWMTGDTETTGTNLWTGPPSPSPAVGLAGCLLILSSTHFT